MRLRRLEIVVICMTLAFACFMGGFFTGRSWSAVNIVAVASQTEDQRAIVIAADTSGSAHERPAGISVNDHSNATPTPANSQQEQTSEASAAPGDGSPRTGDGKININLASQSELTDLPGIGSVLASRIVDHRRQNGDFSKIEDIRNVTGIGEKRFEAIRDKITVG